MWNIAISLMVRLSSSCGISFPSASILHLTSLEELDYSCMYKFIARLVSDIIQLISLLSDALVWIFWKGEHGFQQVARSSAASNLYLFFPDTHRCGAETVNRYLLVESHQSEVLSREPFSWEGQTCTSLTDSLRCCRIPPSRLRCIWTIALFAFKE